MNRLHKGRLRRLPETFYRGNSYVHWTMAMEDRESGWLHELLHSRLREALSHACVRHHLACAVYTFMPDHAHFLLLGLDDNSDQKAGVEMFRRAWNKLLPDGFALARQSYDHVLREAERERDAFTATAHYILENPVRGGLVGRREDWAFSGSLVPGCPSLDPNAEDFWKSFWLAMEAKQGNA